MREMTAKKRTSTTRLRVEVLDWRAEEDSNSEFNAHSF